MPANVRLGWARARAECYFLHYDWRFANVILYEACMRSVVWFQIEMGHDMLHTPGIFIDVVDGPSHRGAERLTQHRSTGFADGRHLLVRPVIRMALPQLFH